MRNKKKALLVAAAMVLVCGISVTGTLSFLKADTKTAVTNTFLASGGGKLIEDGGKFELKEHQVKQNADGTYTLSTTKEVTSNEYKVLPETNLLKDPFIRIQGKTEAPAYLYVEVIDNFDKTGLKYDMEECWKDLKMQGANGGDLYVYRMADANGKVKNAILIGAEGEPGEVPILVDNTITVGDKIKIPSEGITLEFYGYLAQASAGTDAATAYTNCFGVYEQPAN